MFNSFRHGAKRAGASFRFAQFSTNQAQSSMYYNSIARAQSLQLSSEASLIAINRRLDVANLVNSVLMDSDDEDLSTLEEDVEDTL